MLLVASISAMRGPTPFTYFTLVVRSSTFAMLSGLLSTGFQFQYFRACHSFTGKHYNHAPGFPGAAIMQNVAILFDASQAALSTFDLDEVLGQILLIVQDYFHIQRAVIMLVEPKTGDLYCRI